MHTPFLGCGEARMVSSWDLVEQLPISAYALRVVEDEFLLEQINAAGRERNSGIVALCGKPMVALYSDQPQVIEDARRCASEQVVVDRVLRVRRYDRVEATLNLRLTFVPSSPDQVFLFLQDVEDPEVTQTALKESEARYKSLVASLPDGILMRGADGRIVFCNDVAAKWFGAESESVLLGRTDALAPGFKLQTESGEGVDPCDYPSCQVLVTGHPDFGKVYSLTGNGIRRWLRVAAQPIRSENGTISGSVTTLTDITELLQTQRALRESAAQLDLALAAARLGVWEFDLGGNFGWWSPNLDTVFQIGGRAPGLAAFLEHVHPDDRDSLIARAEKLSRGPAGDSFEHEFRIVGKDQVTRWARLRGRRRVETDRRIVLGTVIDITEQRQLEEELKRASRLESIGRLAGGIAHDFNNLLAAMLGSLEFVEHDCPETATEDLATIRQAALRAKDLTRQLLAFARKQPVEWSTVDLAALVRGVEPMLQRLVGPRIEISLTCSEPIPVRADPSQLEQVLVNLAVNARDAMPNGGRLEIGVSRQVAAPDANGAGHCVAVLTVSDSGVGMDEETQRKVFDPFFTTKSFGTGLGLASSYGIIQQHGGTIDVESRPAQGTRFRVTLPSCEEAAPAAIEEPRASVSSQRGSGLLLVVDDEEIVRNTASKMARSLGYEVLVASNASEAIEQFALHRDEIVGLLCDIAMPERDGPSIASELRQTRPDLGVLFMSGYLSDSQEAPFTSASFLQKPFRRAELAEKLRLITGQS